MNKLRKVSLRFPKTLMAVLERDMEEEDLDSLAEAARRRLQLSVNHEELLNELRGLKASQEQMQYQVQLLLFGIKQLSDGALTRKSING